MGRTFAFVDESGNHDLDTMKSGSSGYFVVCAVIVVEKNIQQACELAEAIRSRNFQTGEIKSSNLRAKDSARRKRILLELAELPLKLYFTVVDKSRVHRDGGMQFKKSFIKYVNGLLYQRLFNHCENLHMTVDEHGGPEFQAGLKDYVEARYVDDLFREEAFQTKNSKDDVLIQVADFFAGSIAQIYEGKASVDVEGAYKTILRDITLGILEWPPKYQSLLSPMDSATYADHRVHQAAIKQADLTDPVRQEKLLRLAPVSEVWGVGHRSAAKLAALNISTAWDLSQFDVGTLRKTFGVTMERTARELRGLSCIGFSDGPPPKEAICSSKMFGVRQTELPPIREALAAYVSRAAEKLRSQASLCSTIQVGLQTQLADLDGPRYANAITLALPAPTDDTREILALAQKGLGQIYRPGYPFSKCSILLMDLSQRGELTPDLFAPKPRFGAERLMEVVDQINKREGRGMVHIGRVPAAPAWAMRREKLSPRYTTRWDEVIGVRG